MLGEVAMPVFSVITVLDGHCVIGATDPDTISTTERQVQTPDFVGCVKASATSHADIAGRKSF